MAASTLLLWRRLRPYIRARLVDGDDRTLREQHIVMGPRPCAQYLRARRHRRAGAATRDWTIVGRSEARAAIALYSHSDTTPRARRVCLHDQLSRVRGSE